MSLSLPRFRQLLLWIASFAARAIGWYVIALVDVLDYLPQKYSGRSQLIGYLQRLAPVNPWLYNEYVDGRRTDTSFENFEAGKGLAGWLLKQVVKK